MRWWFQTTPWILVKGWVADHATSGAPCLTTKGFCRDSSASHRSLILSSSRGWNMVELFSWDSEINLEAQLLGFTENEKQLNLVSSKRPIMSDMKYLLVKHSLCSLILKAEKVSEIVIVSLKHFRIFLCTISVNVFLPRILHATGHCIQNRRQKHVACKMQRQKHVDGDCAKARRNDLSLGCGHREVSSVLFGDYFDAGSSQCHGSALCTASGEFDSCLECMIFCLTVLPALKSNS